MKIGIIAAMDQELELLLDNIKIKKIKKIHPFTFYEGKYNNNKIIISKSGVGKVSAGMLLATMCNHYQNIDLIINIGVSGGTMGKVNTFDMVVINGAVYGDVDITLAGDYVYGQMSKCPKYFELATSFICKDLEYKTGFSFTCDRFMTNKKEIDEIIEKNFPSYNILCYDMETAAYAQAAYMYNVPFVATRAISDILGENDDNAFERNLDKACDVSCKFVLNVLDRL